MNKKAGSKKSISKQERIGNLFLLLSSTTTPLSLEYIVSNINGYPKDSHTNRRQMFERDKGELRAGGITIETRQILGAEQYGYIIPQNEHCLQLPNLTQEETSVIGLALKMIALQGVGGETNQLTAVKFNTAGNRFELKDPVTIPYDTNLTDIYDYIQKGLLIKCHYGGKERFIIPGSLKFTMGSWYLIGCQIEKRHLEEIKSDNIEMVHSVDQKKANIIDDISINNKRTLRLDRMILKPEDIQIRKDVLQKVHALCRDMTIPLDSSLPETGIVAKIKIPGTKVDVIYNWLTTGGRLTASKDGYVIIEAYINSNYKNTVQRLIAFGTQIEILEPKELRKEILAYLNTYCEKIGRPLPKNTASKKMPEFLHSQESKVISQLNKMFTIVSYIAKHGQLLPGDKCLVATIKIDELVKVFGGSKESIISDIESLAMFGLPPYTADNLLEVFWQDEEVVLTLTESFLHLQNPFMLTISECLTLVAALKTLKQIIDSKDVQNTLMSCLEKLNTAIDTDNINVDIQIEPELLQKIQFLQASAKDNEVINILYPSKENTLEARFIRAFQVVFRGGQFYLDGYCYTKSKFLRFSARKIDSPRKATDSEKSSLPPAPKKFPPEFRQQSAFIPGENTLMTKVETTPDYAHIFAPHQNTKPEKTKSGNYVFEIAVGNIEWFASLVLSADHHAKVLLPQELADVDLQMAQKLQLLYKD